MSCERYWREGIVLVERGEPDPHRDDCEDCQRVHASRQELIEALPLVGADHSGDPRWQASVWRRIDQEQAPARRWRWQLSGAFAAACVLLLWLGVRNPSDPDGPRPRYKFDGGEHSVAMRSDAEANAGNIWRISVGEKASVWIYRSGELVMQCAARQTADGCSPDDYGMVVHFTLSAPVQYQVLVVESATTLSSHNLDKDMLALEAANIHHELRTVQVR